MKLKTITAIALVCLTVSFLQADLLTYDKVLKNLKGMKNYNSENYDKAEETFSENALKHPDDARLHFNNGNAQYKNGDLDAAEQSYQIAMRDKDFDHKSELYQNMGNVKFQQKDYKNAIGLYRNALVEDPENPDARYNYELASRFLQQQQEQKQQSDKNEENEDQDKKDQENQNQDKQDKENQDKKDQKDQQKNDEQNEDQKNQEQKQQKQSEEKSKEEKQKQQQQKMKKDQEKKDAENILKALLAKEKEEMKKDKEKMNVDKAKTGKYW